MLNIIIPRFDNSGPVKGALALAGGLAREGLDVNIVTLKKGSDISTEQGINVINYGGLSFLRKVISYYRFIKTHNLENVISISSCFSADFFNFLFRFNQTTITSIRGNLFKNYSCTYGCIGYVLAYLHLLMLKSFKKVVFISVPMSRQLSFFNYKRTVVINNFIDEIAMSKVKPDIGKYRQNVPSFVFLGNLISRKRPDLIISAFRKLNEAGFDFKLFIVGDGELAADVRNKVNAYGLEKKVVLTGHLNNPYEILGQADYLVLPSESEGVPRSAMEALFFGKACILRDIDANSELIKDGGNGFLFKKDSELYDILLEICKGLRSINGLGKNLLPEEFRQSVCIKKYKDLINNYGD